MSSDEGPGVSNVVSEYETQFVPRSDDDEVLWAVQEITAERGKQYKVKWVGTDPATGKPWAQSWVAKHDCTDDLVVEWKAKKRRRAERKKRGGRKGTASRASGSSKRAGSSTSAKVRRPTTSEATTSRIGSTREQQPTPPKEPDTKRKRLSVTPRTTPSGARKADEESDLSRPSKKQKMALEQLLPPLSSDDDDDDDGVVAFLRQAVVQDKAPLKKANTPSDASDDDDGSLPTLGVELVGPSDARPRAASISSRASDMQEESKPRDSRPKVEVVIRREERVFAEDEALPYSQDEEPRQHKPKKKPSSHRISILERHDDTPEREEVPAVLPIKIGPPRGVKRKKALRKTGQPSTPRPSRTNIGKVSGDARVSIGKPNGRPSHEVSAPEKPSLSQQNMVDGPSLQPPLRVSIPPVSLNARPHSPVLSPGTLARLELFDQLMARLDAAPSPVDISEYVPDDTHFNYNDNYDTHETFYPPRPLSPPPPNSNLKHVELGTLDGLIVPETESSRNSQSQPQPSTRYSPLPQRPPADPARPPIDLPAIAVISPSAPSSSSSPQGLFPPPRKPLPSINRPSRRPRVRPLPQISPNTFRSTIRVRSRIADPEAPPSSIESFASPKRVDKGKQRAVEVDELQSSTQEGEGDGKRKKGVREITDSLLRKRGKELFDQAQLAREAERQKKKKAKQLKTVDEIVNGTVSPPARAPAPSTDVDEVTMEQWEEVIDLTGGANSATLDTAEHSEAKPLDEEQRERLRIELRQEEEENTQEALGIYPPPPAEVSMGGQDGQGAPKSPPRSPKESSFGGQLEDVDHVEQPSTDLQLASVIVHPSQEQQHEDIDIDPSPPNKPTSSPPRPVPENLTDSPKRRLGEALSLLNVKSEEIQRLERELADGRQHIENLKAELTKAQQSSEPTEPVRAAWEAERAQWAEDRSKWKTDEATWETQRQAWSDDKANLALRVTELSEAVARAEEVGVKLSALEAERVAWTKERDALRSEITQQADELTALAKIRGEHDLDRSKWEAEKASWAEEKARWETDRAALQEKQEGSSRSVDELTAAVELLTSAKASAEKDRDFFREQYAQASGFVNSVREENVELEKRAKIAEGQAQEGVASVKALYEGRVKALQADVGRWKKTSELLQEKDRRTDDELRLRAAQVPELLHLCARLTAANKTLEAEVRKLSRAQRRGYVQENKLYRRLSALKEERRSLKARLAKTVDSGTQDTLQSTDAPPVVQDPDSVDPNDMEILPSFDSTAEEPALYPCMWRPQWRDQCQYIFDAKEDLERHMRDHFGDLANG